MRKSIIFILLFLNIILLSACGADNAQQVYKEEPKSEPVIIRDNSQEVKVKPEEQKATTNKPGLSDINIDTPGFYNEETTETEAQSEEELIVNPGYEPIEIEESSVESSSVASTPKKAGPCLNGDEHNIVKGTVQEATCEIEGIEKTYCNVCNVVLGYNNVPAKGHNWSEYTTVAATCTANGSKSRYCLNCQKKESETLSMINHDFGEYVITTSATCTKAGVQTRTCKMCNKKETKEVPMLNHDYGDWTTSTVPTCSVKGVQTRTCKRCGNLERKELPMLEHTAGSWYTVKEPTCTSKGIRKQKCSVCGADIKSEEIPMIDHEFELFVEDDDNLYFICVVCGEIEEE